MMKYKNRKHKKRKIVAGFFFASVIFFVPAISGFLLTVLEINQKPKLEKNLDSFHSTCFVLFSIKHSSSLFHLLFSFIFPHFTHGQRYHCDHPGCWYVLHSPLLILIPFSCLGYGTRLEKEIRNEGGEFTHLIV